jgi:CheY-like chemotaxis protein
MVNRHKILLLDDDEDLLELYREMLSHLPSRPEIHTASSGARALALMESEPFSLLLSDLNMPRMDGLQVLTIVRRKFPELRTAVMTSVVDEQFRARAYSMGVDLFLEKPNTHHEIAFFLDCVESLLGKGEAGGFRGVQSKGLVDIIQLECLSRSSSVLKITHGPQEGRIWLSEGDIVDAAVQELTGEAAFQKILGWKTGSFEILPAEPSRERTIHGSYQGLLLETAQALDEQAPGWASSDQPPSAATLAASESWLARMARLQGVAFLVGASLDEEGIEHARCENPEQVAVWMRAAVRRFRLLGETFQTGPLSRVEGLGPQCQLSLAARESKILCVGFHRSLSPDLQRETMRTIVAAWAS